VSGSWSSVLVSGLSAHPLQLHSRPGAQAAALLQELCGDHAQRGAGGEDRHPGVPAPVPGPPLELHHRQRQPGHIRTCSGQ
ncbi:hypothetical protein SRHO_G00033070, partial [Serrasalmus rhombeus]